MSLLIKIHLHSLVTLSLRFDYEMYLSISVRELASVNEPLIPFMGYPSSRSSSCIALSIAIIFYLDEYPFKSFISFYLSSNIYIALFEILLPPPPLRSCTSSFLNTWFGESRLFGQWIFFGQLSELGSVGMSREIKFIHTCSARLTRWQVGGNEGRPTHAAVVYGL